MPSATATEIVPGPVVIGIVRAEEGDAAGVALAARASSCSLIVAFVAGVEQVPATPAITMPPATRSTGIEMPKKLEHVGADVQRHVEDDEAVDRDPAREVRRACRATGAWLRPGT